MHAAEIIRLDARVEDVITPTAFRAVLPNGHGIVAFVREEESERAHEIKPGDRVRVEMSPFDMTVGQILRE